MRKTLAGLLTALTFALAFSAPAEAGWKWKKMKWVPKPGQEFRSPYAHPGYGWGRGYGYGYGHGYGSRGYDRPYGYGNRFGGYGYDRPSGSLNRGWYGWD